MKLKKVKDGTETTYDIEASLDKLSGIEAGAQVNQNAFSNITVGNTTIEADNKKDILTIAAGSNIILTPDATNDKITIATTNTPTFTNLTTTNLTTRGDFHVTGATTLDGNLTGKYLTGTWLQTTAATDLNNTPPKVAVLDNSGWIYSRTPDELKSDMGLSKVVLESDLKTTSIELTAIEVEIKDSNGVKKKVKRLENLSYTAKYVPVIPAVFVRIYGKINKEVNMNVGYEYDILNIGSHSPNWQTALAVKSAKNIGAVAKNGNVISVRPLESGISGYDVYIAGFWFV